MKPSELVAEVRKLDAEATPGPLEAMPDDQGMCFDPICTVWSVDEDTGYPLKVVAYVPLRHSGTDMPYEANAHLIARYRTLAPQLADAVEAQAKEIAELREKATFAEGVWVRANDIDAAARSGLNGPDLGGMNPIDAFGKIIGLATPLEEDARRFSPDFDAMFRQHRSKP